MELGQVPASKPPPLATESEPEPAATTMREPPEHKTNLCAELESLLAMAKAAGPEIDMAVAMVHVSQAQVAISAALGAASAELVDQIPDEPWALIASFLEPQDLGSLNCTAKRFGEPVTWGDKSENRSVVEEAAWLQIHRGDKWVRDGHGHPWLSTQWAKSGDGDRRDGETWLHVLARLNRAEKERTDAFALLQQSTDLVIEDHHIQRDEYRPGGFLWFVALDDQGQPTCDPVDTTGVHPGGDGRSALVANLRLGSAFFTTGGYHVAYWRTGGERPENGRRFYLGAPASNECTGRVRGHLGSPVYYDNPAKIQTFDHGVMCWNTQFRGPALMILNPE